MPTALLRSALPALPQRLPRLTREAIEEPPERRVLASYVMTMLSVCLLSMLLNLTVVGQLQHYLAQRHLYGQFRVALASGTAPIGQTDVLGHVLALGTPVARLEIPSLGVDEIVVEGSTSWQTMTGVGHRRDTPLPGQAGVSVLLGRAAAYGGVFGHLDELRPGATIDVLTGQGRSTYEVIGVRGVGSRLPVLGADDGRLTLATASGLSYRPTGVTRVDAELTSTAFPRPPPVLSSASLAGSEQALSGDRSHTFALTWLLELLALMLVASVWSWKRWRREATWLVFAPVLGTIGLAVADGLSGMLPNLM